ncbi:MAG TPA: hypothetical protein VN843_15230 [Anaerolineales bacterium]|nr:hypothetical protein [Anaerolineales bacterium]
MTCTRNACTSGHESDDRPGGDRSDYDPCHGTSPFSSIPQPVSTVTTEQLQLAEEHTGQSSQLFAVANFRNARFVATVSMLDGWLASTWKGKHAALAS